MATGFDEVDFPDGIVSYGSNDKINFNTTIIKLSNGTERRNINWAVPVHVFSISTGNQNARAMAALKSFFIARFGPGKGFRIKDQLDYTTAVYGRDAPAMTLSGSQPFGLTDGTATVFQLVKCYGTSAPYVVYPIFKPVAPTVAIYTGDKTGPKTVATGWSLDATTGLVTFAAAPAAGAILWWSGNFAIPVRFSDDEQAAEFVDGAIMSGSLDIEEIKIISPVTPLFDPSVLA